MDLTSHLFLMSTEFFHITKDGTKLAICQMGDSHLLNTINLYLKNIASAKDYLTSRFSLDVVTDVIFASNREELEASSRFTLERSMIILPRYVFEACIRGLLGAEMMNNIRSAVGRSSAIPIITTPLFLGDAEDLDF